MIAGEVKTCSKCGETKPAELFYKKNSRCKQCFSEIRKQHYADNRKEILEQCHRYYIANREKIKQQHREYVARNHEEHNKRNRNWAAANREKVKEINNKYKAKNRQKEAARSREYRARLEDGYVIIKIIRDTTLTRSDVPPELLEAKRLQLKLKRLAREAMK